MSKIKSMVLHHARCRTEEAESEIREWAAKAGPRGPIDWTGCPAVEVLLAAYHELTTEYSTPMTRFKEKMGGLPTERIAMIVASLEGKPESSDDYDYVEPRSSFEVETICRFYRAVMTLRYGDLENSNLRLLLKGKKYSSVRGSTRQILEDVGFENVPEDVLDVAVDALVDELFSILERSAKPYSTKGELASARSWKYLNVPLQTLLAGASRDFLGYLDYEWTVSDGAGMQVERVISSSTRACKS